MALGRLIEGARPRNVLLAFVGTWVGALATGLDVRLDSLLLVAAAACAGVAGSNLLNDALDALVDRTAHPERVIPQGRLEVGRAARAGVALLAFGVFLAWWLNYWALLLAAFMAANVLFYEFHAKARPLLGHMLVSLDTGLLFLLGAFAALVPPLTFSPGELEGALADPLPLLAPLVMALLAFLLNLARELYKSAEDSAHDRARRETYAVRHGPAAARRLGDFVAWLVLVAAPAPYAFGLFGIDYALLLVPLLLIVLLVPFVGSARNARRWLKLGMLAGFLPFLAIALL